MPGFNELIEELGKKYPDDWWVKSNLQTKLFFPDPFPEIEVYEAALHALDLESWVILSKKAHEAFREKRNTRGKSQFFSLLNEALAYEYLVKEGYSNIRLIADSKKKKTPDISCKLNGKEHCCEVKTINISTEEINRISSGEVFDASIYQNLSKGFIDKLIYTINSAVVQITSYSSYGLVYVIINFDDFTLSYYHDYDRQISEILSSQFKGVDIVIRIGVLGMYYIRQGDFFLKRELK